MLALKTRMLNYERIGWKEKLEEDKKRVIEYFSKYPYLNEEIEHFAEFITDD